MKKYSLQPQSLLLPAGGGIIAGFLSESFPLGVAVFALLFVPVWMRLYFRYIKDNPKKYWFKRKLYGWGWVPATWQGWLVTLIYAVLIIAFALTIDEKSPPQEIMFTLILPFVLLTVAFFRIAYKKGESPKWQWGSTERKN